MQSGYQTNNLRILRNHWFGVLLYFSSRWNNLQKTQGKLLCIIGLNGSVKMCNLHRCNQSCFFPCCLHRNASERASEPKSKSEAAHPKVKNNSGPEPLSTKEYSSGVKEDGFIRPPNCVGDRLLCSIARSFF